ncbi:MAG TPA: hypothetical protein VFL83_06285 [Anaeromyxobacter sp.]|nr:hypothetical protein [Anaeromyxobacter sp.]
MLLASAVIGLVAVAVAALVVARRRRRRAVRGPALSLGSPRGPAGVNHLANRVSELSDLDVHLRAGAMQKRSLGALLGSSIGASR